MFWNPATEGIGFASTVHGEFNFFLNLHPFLKKPILMCFVAAGRTCWYCLSFLTTCVIFRLCS
jgi:hypothetical protein